MNNLRRFFIACAVLLLLAACGQKGDLVRPAPSTSVAAAHG